MPSHILLLLGTSHAVNANRALLRRVFPLMHMITLSSAGPCYVQLLWIRSQPHLYHFTGYFSPLPTFDEYCRYPYYSGSVTAGWAPFHQVFHLCIWSLLALLDPAIITLNSLCYSTCPLRGIVGFQHFPPLSMKDSWNHVALAPTSLFYFFLLYDTRCGTRSVSNTSPLSRLKESLDHDTVMLFLLVCCNTT